MEIEHAIFTKSILRIHGILYFYFTGIPIIKPKNEI